MKKPNYYLVSNKHGGQVGVDEDLIYQTTDMVDFAKKCYDFFCLRGYNGKAFSVDAYGKEEAISPADLFDKVDLTP